MSPDLSQKLSYPYTVGVYLAVNAIPDAYLVMDGPGCAFYRAMTVHGRHDWASTLLDCAGEHRVQYAGVDANSIASNYEERLREAVRAVASYPRCSVVLLGAMPICTLAGTQHERILEEERGGKPGALVPGRSLAGDWLDGYDDTLLSLARGMDLSGSKPARGCVGVVGNFMDRREGDGGGNAAELGRLLKGIGARPGPVWLCGEGYERLREIRRAETIVSLPHGRKAAAFLARKLRARLVEAGLPIGLDGTRAWLRQVGEATGRARAAEGFIERELRRLAPRLERAIPASFLAKKVVYVGDSHRRAGLAGMLEELGMELVAAFVNGGEGARPTMAAVSAAWAGLREQGVDLLIGNGDAVSMLKPRCAWIELGFPSVWTHSLREEPFLGFKGAACLADRMANAMSARAREEA